MNPARELANALSVRAMHNVAAVSPDLPPSSLTVSIPTATGPGLALNAISEGARLRARAGAQGADSHCKISQELILISAP